MISCYYAKTETTLVTSFHAYHLKKKNLNSFTTPVFSQLCSHICTLIFRLFFCMLRKVHSSESPHLKIIRGLFDDLWSHPERSSHKSVSLDLGVCELSRHPKVCQLHISLLRQQHVGSCHKIQTWIISTELRFHRTQMIKYEALPSRPNWVGRRVGYHTFDITVNLPLRMQVFQSLQNLPQYSGNVRLL